MNDIKSWKEIARENQMFPKGDWSLWMILAGRGFGKTRTGAENVMELVNSGKYNRIAIIGKTILEAKSIMVEGISGLLSTTTAQKAYKNAELGSSANNVMKFRYYKSKNQIIWENGAVAYLIGADNYDSMRGLQFDLIWVDEFAKFSHPEEVWTQIMFTLRLGENPICIMTTTPRPLEILKELSEDEKTHLTNGSTFENKSNLSARFVERMEAKYMKTTYGKQELYGELSLEKKNTVWKEESVRYREIDKDSLERVVIGVDPSVSVSENSDETGIIVAGLGFDERIYVLDDLSGKYTPPEWAKTVCNAYQDYQASNVIVETNNGGDLVSEMIKTIHPNIPITQTKAIKGKITRAHPIALLYESNRVFHTKRFEKLEKQMRDLSYDKKTKNSPDRVDALVWAIHDLKSMGTRKYHISSIEF
ncbi:MAG: terminase family protein [Holosporales bacterium]|jgi:predicted phage terminase large subunit-like protein|nr:terminase family protein [Holosporales bacterium]